MPELTPQDIKQAVSIVRPDLIPDSGDSAREQLQWIINAYRDYPGVLEQTTLPHVRTQFAQPAVAGDYEAVLTVLVYEIWLMREDLQGLYDLESIEGQESFVWWFFSHGVAEYELYDFLSDAQDAFLFENVGGVPRLAFHLWETRRDLQEAYNLGQKDGVSGLLSWFYQVGLSDVGLQRLISASRADTLLREVAVGQITLPYVLNQLWMSDSTLRLRFPDRGHPALREWFHSEADEIMPLLSYLRQKRVEQLDRRWPHKIVPREQLSEGVNLVGFAQGQLGVGEDVRMAANALQAVDIPFGVVNIPLGGSMSDPDDQALASFYDNSLRYDTTLFCMTGLDMLGLAARHGELLFSSPRVIGFWPWELSDWPQSLQPAFNFVDELWASSTFVYQALVKATDKPVRLVPMTVDVATSAGLGRMAFGMKEKVFYFVFSFDFMSKSVRKNPMAVISAFHTAFARNNRSVGLVVKAMRAQHDDLVWSKVMAIAAEDERIVVIADTLRRGEVLDLYRCCNCFVSLHRSEGFGRGIAEAMLLGKPVIVTAYSGSLDFAGPGRAALVDYTIRPLAEGEYPHGDGQYWVEPNITQAATWMKRMVEDSCFAQNLAISGFQAITAAYSAETVGRYYKQLLTKI